MATINDVARKAGVSVSTVSNVLNNPNVVSEEKYKKVIDAIQELKYVPNLHASNLRTSKKNTIAIVLPELSLFFGQLADEIITGLSDADYSCIVEETHYDPESEIDILKRLIAMGVSGVFLYSCAQEDNSILIGEFTKTDIPIVLIQNCFDSSKFTLVRYSFNKLAARMAAEVQKQPEYVCPDSIMIVTGPLGINYESECLEGFLSAFPQDRLPQTATVRLGVESVCLDFLNLVLNANISDFPRIILTTSENVCAGIKKALEYLKYDSIIYYVGSDSWYHLDDLKSIAFPTPSAKIAKACVKVMLKFLNNPKYFEPEYIKVDDETYTIRDEKKQGSCIVAKPSHNTIRILAYYRPWLEVLQKVIPVFERTHDISVDFELVPTSVEEISRISDIPDSRDTSDDIFIIPHYCMDRFGSRKYLLCLDDFNDPQCDAIKNEYPDGIKKLCNFDSAPLFALPFTFNTQMLFYREDLFERDDIRHQFYREYGIELAPPRTWTDFNLIARFFTKEYNPDSPVQFGTTISMSDKSPITDEFLPRQWSYHGRIFDKETGKPIMTSMQNVKALTNVFETYNYTPGASGADADNNSFYPILNNQTAMLHSFTTYISNIKDKGSIDAKRISCVGMPGGNTLIGGWLFAINKYSQHPEESFQLIKWLCDKAYLEQNAMLGLFNPQSSLLESPHCIKVLPWASNFLKEVSKAGRRESMATLDGRIIYPRAVVELLHKSLSESLLAKRSVEDALNRINTDLTDIYYGKNMRELF